MYDIIVAGGGASGLTSAIIAKRCHSGASVAVIEKLPRVAKKILVTGNGRCNLANRFAGKAQYNNDFAGEIFKVKGIKELEEFFSSIGLFLQEESDGRLYPHSNSASSVSDALRFACEKEGVKIITDVPVKTVKKQNDVFLLNDGKYSCRKLILACGGKAASVHGSDGSGFSLAKMLGHSITPLYPALVPLLSDDPLLKSLKGIRCPGVDLYLSGGAKRQKGEIQFAEGALSGIIAMELGAETAKRTSAGQKTVLTVDLLPDLTNEEVFSLLKQYREIKGNLPLDEMLTGIFQKPLGIAILKKSGCYNGKSLCRELGNSALQSAAETIKALEFNITGTKGFDNAQVTRGGIKTNEIYPESLQSKICPGLYFAGEIIDIDGLCGGYNLSFAFACGLLAGELNDKS